MCFSQLTLHLDAMSVSQVEDIVSHFSWYFLLLSMSVYVHHIDTDYRVVVFVDGGGCKVQLKLKSGRVISILFLTSHLETWDPAIRTLHVA